MAQQNVFIGRVWPVMPTYARVTVGTREEMDQFQVAFQKVMKGTVAVGKLHADPPTIDGFVLPS
jgi:histidinol-phosphate aminotransferase